MTIKLKCSPLLLTSFFLGIAKLLGSDISLYVIAMPASLIPILIILYRLGIIYIG